MLVIDQKKIFTDTKAILKYLVGIYCQDDDSLYPIDKQEEVDSSLNITDRLAELVSEIYVSGVDGIKKE